MQFQKEERMNGGWCDYESIRRPGRNVAAESRAESSRSGNRGSNNASSRGASAKLSRVDFQQKGVCALEDDAEVESVRAGDAPIISLQL